MRLVSVILLSAILMSGCAIKPSIKSDKDLKPDTVNANDFPCLESSNARECALLTIHELNKLLEGTGKFNRGAAYTALGLGTAAASVLTFGGGKHALEGLAIASGSLLGLNTVVNTATQIEIYEKALKDVFCGIKAHDSLEEAKGKISFTNQNFISVPASISAAATADAYKSGLEHAYHNKLVAEANALNNALSEAESSAKMKLSTIVIETRAEVRRRLATVSGNPENINKEQRDRIIDMIGEIIKKWEALKDTQNEQPSEQPAGTSIVSSQTALRLQESNELVSDISPVDVAFSECVDPAVQKLLRN